MNEVLAPHMLRKIVMRLEDRGYTSVPIHNPFAFHLGQPVRPGGTEPDGGLELRVTACAAGLGELGHSKTFLTPEFGPRQRLYAVLTDAELEPDPLLQGAVCDECGTCVGSCPAGAIGEERTVEIRIGDRVFCHAPFDKQKCFKVHLGWDPKYSPFLKGEYGPDNPPPYYSFNQRRFRHMSICAGRGCIRACMDHLEKTGKSMIEYKTPMIEGKQWVIEDQPE